MWKNWTQDCLTDEEYKDLKVEHEWNVVEKNTFYDTESLPKLIFGEGFDLMYFIENFDECAKNMFINLDRSNQIVLSLRNKKFPCRYEILYTPWQGRDKYSVYENRGKGWQIFHNCYCRDYDDVKRFINGVIFYYKDLKRGWLPLKKTFTKESFKNWIEKEHFYLIDFLKEQGKKQANELNK